jgi:hypothetical protein
MVICGFLAACGGSIVPAASPYPLSARVGDTLHLTSGAVGKSMSLDATFTGTKRVPALKSPAAQEHPALFGVRIVIKNTGTSLYRASIYRCSFLKSSPSGALLHPFLRAGDANGSPLPSRLSLVKVAPGATVSRWVWFAAAKAAHFNIFYYRPKSWGFIGAWLLPGSKPVRFD